MSEDKKHDEGGQDYVPQNEEAGSHEAGHAAKDKKRKKTDPKDDLIHQLHVKNDELNDKYLRLYSEFDNYRKRTQKERIEQSRFASEDILLSLLPVIDDLERALKSTIKTGEGQEVVPTEGIQLIYNKFKGILAQKGLEIIPALGEPFNVDFHDALTNIPAPSEEQKGKVVDEIEKGYKLYGKVIRYAKVVVGI